MGALKLADWLQDFGERARVCEKPSGGEKTNFTVAAPAPDPAAMTAIAVAAAEAALEIRLAAHHESAIEAERARHAAEIDAVLARCGADAGATILSALDAMEQRLTHLTAASAGRILGGLVGDDLRRRSIEGLARSISDAVSDAQAVRVKVRGPRSMFEALAAALGDRAASLDFTEAAGFDLAVNLDDRILETRLAEWSAVLGEALS